MAGLPIIRDYMDKVVPTLAPDTGILEAVDFLLTKHVTGAPVVDDKGMVIGILTEKDCLRLLSTGMEADVPRGNVRDFMSTNVTFVSPDMNVYFVWPPVCHLHATPAPAQPSACLAGASGPASLPLDSTLLRASVAVRPFLLPQLSCLNF